MVTIHEGSSAFIVVDERAEPFIFHDVVLGLFDFDDSFFELAEIA